MTLLIEVLDFHLIEYKQSQSSVKSHLSFCMCTLKLVPCSIFIHNFKLQVGTSGCYVHLL